MGLDPEHPAITSGVQTRVENTIVSIALLDAFIATTVVCLREDGTDTVGSHRQKLYHETLKTFVAEAYSQITGKVLGFVHDWVPYKLEGSAVTVNAGLSSSSVVHSRKATVEIFVSSLKRPFIAVSWDWFRNYITIELGTDHDCYIAEYESAINDVRLPESSVISPDNNFQQTFPLPC